MVYRLSSALLVLLAVALPVAAEEGTPPPDPPADHSDPSDGPAAQPSCPPTEPLCSFGPTLPADPTEPVPSGVYEWYTDETSCLLFKVDWDDPMKVRVDPEGCLWATVLWALEKIPPESLVDPVSSLLP